MSEIKATLPKAAGCLFIENTNVLTGHNPQYNIWSGIGGKIMPNESPRKAAFRETIEELFGFNPSDEILMECCHAFSSTPMLTHNSYAFIPISFIMYIHLSYILRAYKCISPYYYRIPESFDELIYTRKPTISAEITTLKVINYKEPNPIISTDLLDDCYLYEKNRCSI